MTQTDAKQRDIAIVGMLCRVPGAADVDSLWSLLSEGREGLRSLSAQELETLKIKKSDHYVAAGGFIDDIDLFDAEYFGFTAREATYMDPQHRLWLEACCQLLEITGNRSDINHNIGVFASAGHNSYIHHILSHQSVIENQQATLLGNVADCLATRVSYTLNLTGPSMTIQSGCSSALVAVHQARVALLAKQCDAALVGGICIAVPALQGYSYVEGGFASPDGHCRPFSEDAAGTVFSSGFGVVLLKRLPDALAAGDHIYAVIKGSAINNDGSNKASFTAPSVEGQASAIAKAIRVSGVEANAIQYVETHGTGTPIGDPIELKALAQAFAQVKRDVQEPCLIGSIKANLGHLDVAAGIISLIKTALMLQHKKLLPQINFTQWNKNCVNADKHFSINTQLKPWESTDPLRAGVSAFGFGGTNAHIILEEVISDELSEEVSDMPALIMLSETTQERLMQWVQSLKAYLLQHPDISLAQLAYTLQVGKKQLKHRILTRANSVAELINILNRVTTDDFVTCEIDPLPVSIENKTLHTILQEWLSGKIFNWHTQNKRKKVTLPPLPLNLKSYWVEANANQEASDQLIKEADAKKWIYQNTWRQKIVPLMNDFKVRDFMGVLVLGKLSHPLTLAFTQYLTEQKLPFVCCDPILEASDIEKKYAQGKQPNLTVLILDECDSHEKLPNILLQLARLPKVLQHLKQVTTVVTNMSDLACHEFHAEKSGLIAYVRGLGQEFPTLQTQLLDLDAKDGVATQLTQLISSLNFAGLLDVAIWRDLKCWQYDYQMLPEMTTSTAYFVPRGVYVITGGLGDVASVHVDFLAQYYQAQLYLLGRSDIPAESEWDDLLINSTTTKSLKQKIMRLQQWKKQGYAIKLVKADVTQIDQLRQAYQQIMTEQKQIDGVIHIAGAGSDMHYKIMPEITWQHCQALLNPKLAGIGNIDALMNEFNISNCLVISSISSALTGIGLSAYGATHNILDAMVRKYYPSWRIMNWDAWNFHQNEHQAKEMGDLGSDIDRLAITPQEGLDVLRYAFTLPAWQQVFVSTANLLQRVNFWTQRGFLKNKMKPIFLNPRPKLHTEYVKPHSVLQDRLANHWAAMLGIEKVGINDSFFELGGHSLLALELIHGLQVDFNYACSVVDLFAAPTIAQLAHRIEAATQVIDVKETVLSRVHRQRAAQSRYQQQ